MTTIIHENEYGFVTVGPCERTDARFNSGWYRMDRFTSKDGELTNALDPHHANARDDVSAPFFRPHYAPIDPDEKHCGWCYLNAAHTVDAHRASAARWKDIGGAE